MNPPLFLSRACYLFLPFGTWSHDVSFLWHRRQPCYTILPMTVSTVHDHDFIIIGSGFGGSVSALRLSEKGYRVLVLEKGKRWQAEDFPKRNWSIRQWLWLPLIRAFGFFKIPGSAT